MALSAFEAKAGPPTDSGLRATLGAAYAAWIKLPALIADRIGPVTDVWKFTGPSTGWGMRLLREGRVIVYMTPQRNQFLVSFALGEKAVAAARAARLPASVLDAIDAAPCYAEGRGVRIPVRSSRQLVPLARLAEIKCDS